MPDEKGLIRFRTLESLEEQAKDSNDTDLLDKVSLAKSYGVTEEEFLLFQKFFCYSEETEVITGSPLIDIFRKGDLATTKNNLPLYFDLLYSTFSHGSSHIGEKDSEDLNRIPDVNEWINKPEYKNGHSGLMSSSDKVKLDNLTKNQNNDGTQSFKDVLGISGTANDYIVKLHKKIFVGGQSGTSPNFASEEWSDSSITSLIPDRGALIYGGVHLGIDNSSTLKIGNPATITLTASNGNISAKSLTLTEQFSIDDIQIKKCLTTSLDNGSDTVLEICKNKIINDNGTSFDDIQFYVNKGENSTIIADNTIVPTMIIGEGGVAINRASAPNSSSNHAFDVNGSVSIGTEGSDVNFLRIFGSLLQFQSTSGVTIKNLAVDGGQATSLDIVSFGGLNLQGDGTIGNDSPVTVGHTNNRVGISNYGSINMSNPSTNSYPFAFYNDLSSTSTSRIGSSPLTLFVDGSHHKVGIGDLPGTQTMRVIGGAEFISKSTASTANNWNVLGDNEGDNKVQLSVVENPGNTLSTVDYDALSGSFGAKGTLILRGTNQTRKFETITTENPNGSNDDIFDIILTGGLSDAWLRTPETGIQHGVRIDGKLQIAEKVKIKTGGLDVTGNVVISNGSIDLDAGKTFTIGSNGLVIGGDTTGSTYYFSENGKILADSILLGFIYNNSTEEYLTTRYGMENDGTTKVHDIYIYGDLYPQNITNIDLQGGQLRGTHDVLGFQAPKPDSSNAFQTPKDGFYGNIKNYKNIVGSGEIGYLTGNNTDGIAYHTVGSTSGGGHAYPYNDWSSISEFHNIFSVSTVLKEYGYDVTNPVFSREDQLIGKLSGFKYLLAGDYSKHDGVGDSPTTKPYIRGFSSIYGLFSDSETNNVLNKSWDGTNAGDIMYFKNIVGFDTNNQSGVTNKQPKLIEDSNDETLLIVNPSYPTYLGGSISYFKSITGVSDTFHRGSISNFKDISLSYFDQTLKRDITTAEFTRTTSSIFNSLLTIGDPTGTLDSYSGFVFKGGGNPSQKDVTLNWDSNNSFFSFHYTDTPSTPSSPDANGTPAPNHSDWATVKVGNLWVKGEELTTPVSVLNALNNNGILFTDGTNKMLADLNINRNNINHTTIAYVDEIKITQDPVPFHLTTTDPTTLDIYSVNGSVSPGYSARSLLISPDDNAYIVLGQDNKTTSLIVGKSDNSTSKIIAGWTNNASANLSLNYRNSSGTITEGLQIENDGDINVPVGDVKLVTGKSLTIGTTETILNKDSITVGTNTTLAGTGITVNSDFNIKTGGSSGTVNFKIINSNGYVGIGDWSSGTISHALDVKGTIQSSGTTSGTETTFANFKDSTDPYIRLSKVNHVKDSSNVYWSTISSNATSNANKKLHINSYNSLNLDSDEVLIGGVDSDGRGWGEQGRFSFENVTLSKTSTSGTFSGTYFSIGLKPRSGGNVTPSTNSPPSYSAITSALFQEKSNKFLRMFSDSTEWHDTHLYYKPTLVIGSPDDVSYWDSSSSSLKTKDVIPFSEMENVANPPSDWSLRTRYLQTASTPQDASNNDTKFTFFIDVPTAYSSADKIFEVGYYITGFSTNGSTDNTTRFYITRIDDYTTSSPKGFQIHTVPTDDTKIPDLATYTNTNWKYRKVVIPTLTVNGVLKADNLGTSSLDATDLAVKKVCWSPVGSNLPKACIYIAEDSTDSNKNKWFFDADTELDDLIFTGKGDNSVNYSFTAQEKLYSFSTGNQSAWTSNFGSYNKARNTVLKVDNLADSDNGAKLPKLVMSVSASGVRDSSQNTTPVQGVDFFELKTDGTTIATVANPYNSSENLVEYGKNAIMSLYRHKKTTGTTQTLSSDWFSGNGSRDEYFRVDAREYYYESNYQYNSNISSGDYDSFIRGTFDIKDHNVNPSNGTDTPGNLLGLKLGGVLVESTSAELNYLSNVTPGTNTANGNKALVTNGSQEIDLLKISSGGNIHLPAVSGSNGTKLGGTLITATANEINILDGLTTTTAELNYNDFTEAGWIKGIVQSGKTVVVNANKYINEWHVGDVTVDNSSNANNPDKHRIDLGYTHSTANSERKYEHFIKTTSDTSPTNFSNLTIESQQHLYLQTKETDSDYDVNGNIYIKPDNKLYFQAKDSHYLFGTKKASNFVSIGGDFSSEESDTTFATNTPTTLLYADVNPTISGVSTDVVTNKKKIILGFLTTSTITPNSNDYLKVTISGGVQKKLQFDTVQSLSTNSQATVPNIAGYNNTNRNWYSITLTEDISNSITGVYGQTVALPNVLNSEFGVIPANSDLNQRTAYNTYKTNNASDPYSANPNLYTSSTNVAISNVNISSTSPVNYASKFSSVIADNDWTTNRQNNVANGNAYLVGIRNYWQNPSGTKYDGDDQAPSGSYSLGNGTTILVVDDYLWAGKEGGIHDWHQISSVGYIGQHTVDSQAYDWYYVELSGGCGLTGVFGQLGNSVEHRSGSGFTFVDVTETGNFLENPDQALTLQGVMSMVGIDPVYVSPYATTETPHYYSDANSTTGYLQNPAPINNRGHLWFEQDTSSLQFSTKSDALWNETPLFTPSVSDEFEQLNDLVLTTVDSAEVAVDTEIIVEVVGGEGTSPNTFKWKKTTDSAWSSNVNMSTSNITLISDSNSNSVVSIKFGAITGHSEGSRWRFRKGNVVHKNLSSGAGLWEQVTNSLDIMTRSGNVGIFKRDSGTPDPIDALHLAHTTGNLLLQYPSDTTYSWTNTDAPDLIIKQAKSNDPKSITLGLSSSSSIGYRPRLEIENDHFNIDTLDSKNIYLQQNTLAGKFIIGSTNDLGTKVSINGDAFIQKDSTSPVLTVDNSKSASGTKLELSSDENVLFDGTIINSYDGVSTIQPSQTIGETTYSTEPSYIGSEKIFNISDTSNTYLALKRTPAFSSDNNSKGALGIGTDRPYKKLHVKDGNILVENSEPTLSLGTPDQIYKSGDTPSAINSSDHYAEIHLNKDSRLNFSAGDSITRNGQTQPDWNHGGKLDIIYRRGYNKIDKPSFTNPNGGSNSGSANFEIDDQNLLEFTTTTYDDTGSFPTALQPLSTKTRLVLDGETGNLGIGDAFERYPAKTSINPVYKLDVQGGLRLSINFNSLSGFEARTTGFSGGYLNNYKYTYDTNTTGNGTNSDFVITKEVVESVERFGGTPPSPDLRSYQHTIDQTETSTYPYVKNNTTDAKKMDYLATVQVSGMGVSYFSGGNVGIGSYFEDTRNVDVRKPTTKFHVKDFAFTEVADDNWTYDAGGSGDADSTIADANKFTESSSVLMATFEDVEKSSYGVLHNSTQQTSKWLSNTAGGKLNIYTKRDTVNKKTIAISSEDTRDGLLLDATGDTSGNSANFQLYLQKDGDVGVGTALSFLSNVSNAITKRNTLKRVTGVGSGSNLNGLEIKYENTALPQIFLTDTNKVTINTYNPGTTSTSGQFYLYDADDNVTLAYASATSATLTYGDSNINSYTTPDASDTLKFGSTTITISDVSISGQVVTITTSGLSSFSDQTVFRHDLLGTIDATLTVSGYISADNIDPSGITIGNNEALTVQHSGTKYNALMRRYANGSIGGKDLFLHAGNLDADLHLATFHDTGTSSTDKEKIRMTIGDSKIGSGAYDSFIDIFEDVNIKTAKDFIIYDNAGTPAEKFKVLGATGNTTIAGTLGVTGLTTLQQTTIAGGNASSINNTPIGATTASTGAFTTLSSSGLSTLNSLSVANNAGITGTLTVTSTSQFNDNVAVADGKTFTVGTGLSTFGGGVKITTSKDFQMYDSTSPTPVKIFEILGATGNTDIGGTLNIGSKTTGNLTINKAGDFTIKDASGSPATKFSVDGTTGNTVIGVSGDGAGTTNGKLTVHGLATLNRTEVSNDMFVDDQLGVGFGSGDSHLSTFDVKNKVKYAGANPTVDEKRPIVATFTKLQKNSSGTSFGDNNHVGSTRIYISPRPFISNHPLTHSGSETEAGNSSESNVVELEVNAVANVNDHYQNTGLGDFLIKNHYSNTTGTAGFIRFIVAKPATTTYGGNQINFSTGSSVVFGANDTYGQIGINTEPLSGLNGANNGGATLALKGKQHVSASGVSNNVQPSIFFETYEDTNTKKAWMIFKKDEITNRMIFDYKFEGSPVVSPFTVKDNSVELGTDIVTQLYDHTKIEETLGTSSSQTQFVVADLDHLSDTTTDYIRQNEFVRIYQHDNSDNFIRRKVSSVNTTTKVVTLDSAIPSAYEFSTVYFNSSGDGTGNGHSVEISNIGTIYTGTFNCDFQIRLGTAGGVVNANKYQWRRTTSASDSSYTAWEAEQDIDSGNIQDLGANGGLDDFGVKIRITTTNNSNFDTLTFKGRKNTAKLEVYSDIDIGSTDNYFDDVYAQGFAMKKGSAPGNDTDYGKLWVKDSDGYLYFQNSSGNSQQLSDLSNNFSSVNVDLVPDTTNTRNIGKEGTASSYSDRKTFKDIIYSGSIKRWNGTGYTVIGETSVAPPTKHAIQINANSNTYVIDDSNAYFTVVNSEFDDTIKESYLDVKFDYTPTDTMVDEGQSSAIGDNTTYFETNPEIVKLNTSLLVPLDFSSWRDTDNKLKIKCSATNDVVVEADLYDTANVKVGNTQTLAPTTSWSEISLTEFVPNSGTPTWTKGETFNLQLTIKLKETTSVVSLSTLKLQYNTESYSTTNVPLPHISSTSGNTEIDQQLTVAGDILPSTDGDKDLGSTSKRWDNVYTNDLHLNNEGSQGNEVDGTTGNWTVQEGDEDLFIINRKTGKKFKFKLEEIE